MTVPDIIPEREPLNARLAEWVSYAATIRSQLLEFVQSLPKSAHEKRLTPEGWSIAGILEHLVLIEDGIGRLINRMSRQIRAEGHALESDSSSILGMLDAFAVDDNTRKLVAPGPYGPTGNPSVPQTMEKLQDVRSRLLSAVEAANGVDLGKASAPHPFFGPLTGYQWLVLIAKHELRHLNQMREILSASPAATE